METIKIEDLNEETATNIEKTLNYIPFAEKVAVVKKMIEINTRQTKGVYGVNYTNFYMSMYLIVMGLYFNISFKELTSVNYDRLKKTIVLDELIDEEEKKEWRSIVSMEFKNLEEINSYKNVVQNFVNSLNKEIEVVLQAITNMIDRGDPEKIAKILSPVVKEVADKMPNFQDEKQVEKFKNYFKQ